MAIHDTFSLDRAIRSEAEGYKAWYNYHYCNNTMGISSSDMNEIYQAWKGKMNNWQATASKDSNKYEMDDYNYELAKQTGQNQAKNVTGFDGSRTASRAGIVRDASGAIGSGAAKIVGKEVGKGITKKLAEETGKEVAEKIASNICAKAAGKATEKVGSGLFQKAAAKAVEKVASKTVETGIKNGTIKASEDGIKAAATEATKSAGKEAGKKVGDNISCIVGCSVGFATATAYMVDKPNEKEKKACDTLQGVMTVSQGELNDEQENMAAYDEELIELADESQEANEEAAEKIDKDKTVFDGYRTSVVDINQKVEAGEQITEEDKTLYDALQPKLQQLNKDIKDNVETTTETVADNYSQMEEYQDEFDRSAETVANVDGKTTYAESFDEATKTGCIVEAAAQGLNATTTGVASYKAFAMASSGSWFFGSTAWAYAFGVLGATGAAMSATGSYEQGSWVGKVGTEIEMRKVTQDLDSTTSDIYDERVDDYQGYMESVETLELDVPKDVDVPETPDGLLNGEKTKGEEKDVEKTSFNDKDDDKDKDKKDKVET